MNRDEFFQRAILLMAEKIMDRAQTTPKPEELASTARRYAEALHDEMLAGLTNLDIFEAAATPAPGKTTTAPSPPVLGPGHFTRPRTPPVEKEEVGPTCPKCDGPMKHRTGTYGPFWGCVDYPRCRGIVK